MTQMECDTVTGLAHWAPAIINGDYSGLENDDKNDMVLWIAGLAADGWYVVSDVEGSERFTWHGELYGSRFDGCSVCDYVVHRRAQ